MSKALESSLTTDILRQRARSHLLQTPPAMPSLVNGRKANSTPGHSAGRFPDHSPSDFDLNPDARHTWTPASDARAAAVLVPIIAHPAPTVLFTQRPEHLTVHAGQISFPGGKVEPQDAGFQDTAFREALEEIGLSPEHIEPLGYLDAYLTGTGFTIAPLVGLIDPSFQPQPEPSEVAEVFEVPLEFLMQPGNHQKHTRLIKGRERSFYAMPFEDRFIWGATAGILKNMHARICGQ